MAALIPNSTSYNKSPPMGYPTSNKIYKFNPQGFLSNNIGFNDVVRFLIQLSDGYWDPYSTFMNVTVDVTSNSSIAGDIGNTTNPYGYVMQMDGSAHSLFNSLIIYKDGTELERIMEYDTIANVLQDMNYNPLDRRQREQEGCGGMNVPSVQTAFTFPTNAPATTAITSDLAHWNPGYTFDSVNFGVAGAGGSGNPNQYSNAQTTAPLMCWSDSNLCPQDPFNPTNLGNTGTAVFNAASNTGQGAIYPALGTSPMYPIVAGTTYTTSSVNYPLGVPLNYANDQPVTGAASGNVGFGFTNPFSSNFAQTCMEPKFTGITCQRAIINGSMTATNNVTHQFSFPLISGLLGILMPPTQYKLIPMAAFKDLVLEFKMNPYAMFTSNPGCPRNYRITKFELVTELVYFDSDTTRAIESQLDQPEGIVLQTLSWYLGPIYNIANNVLPGSIQVNLGFESLKSVLVVILRNDYQATPCARKQYRLTHNVNSLQIKIGTDFYPQQPIQGNASSNIGQNNNSEFYVHMLRAFNRLHQADSQHCIGVGNYAINFSVWNYTQQIQLGSGFIGSGTQLFNIYQLPGLGTNYTLGTPSTYNTQNMTRDISYYFENAIVGKGLFGIDLEGLNYGGGYILGGVNTILSKPFEILLQYSNQGTLFPNNSSVYTFCLYDFMLKLNRNQIVVLGRG